MNSEEGSMTQVAPTGAPVILPPSETVSVEVAAARLGLSRGKAYELARRNALPVPVLRFGRKMVIPARALDRLLMATPDDTPGDALTERVA
jgi:excisionase family DNA binding protein